MRIFRLRVSIAFVFIALGTITFLAKVPFVLLSDKARIANNSVGGNTPDANSKANIIQTQRVLQNRTDNEYHDEHEYDHDHDEGHDEGHEHGDEQEHEDEHQREHEHQHDTSGYHDHDEQTHEDDHSDEKPWKVVFQSTLLLNSITLIGVLIFPICGMRAFAKGKEDSRSYAGMAIGICVPAFAVGALLATAVFLILPEALVLINARTMGSNGHNEPDHRLLEDSQEGHDHDVNYMEPQTIMKFGIALIGGIIFPIFLNVLTRRLFPGALHNHDNDILPDPLDKIVPTEEVAECVETKVLSNSNSKNDVKQRDNNLISSVLFADALHNFADGIFVGTAFLACSRDVAWTILAATAFHEFAQELADFFLLTVHANLCVVKALVFNFICGLFGTFGALLVIYVDMSKATTGIVLTMSAGVYFHITMIECYPVLEKNVINDLDWLLAFFFFLVGVVGIGVVLLIHLHCG